MTIQRAIEMQAIPTVCITVEPDETLQARPPRALHPRGYGPGWSLGRPKQPDHQKLILLDALRLLSEPVLPGTVVSRDYE